MEKTGRNHEIITPQRLLNDRGGLTEAGWARSQLLSYDRQDIKTAGFRIKEWDYYLVMNRDYGIAFTISDDGYFGLQSVSLLDFTKGWEHTETVLNVLPMGKLHMPSDSGSGDVVYEDKRLQMSFRVQPGKRMIACRFRNFCGEKDLSASITLYQPEMESMVIATPFADKKHAFYYNQKINCMRAEGCAEFDGVRYEFCPKTDFGTLDWGRGVWTYDNVWYWGNGNFELDGHEAGFNIGYGFGDTGRATENVLLYDGKIHKLADVTFHIPQDDYLKPWRFSSSDGRFEMAFIPVLDRAARINALVIETDQHQVFGKLSGKAVLDDGTVLNIEDKMCFAEKVHNRY